MKTLYFKIIAIGKHFYVKRNVKEKKKILGNIYIYSIYTVMAKIVRTLGIFKRFVVFCWIGYYNTHKTNYCRNYLRWKESAEHWKWWTGPLKVRPQTPSSKLSASWKINWTDLLYIQRKAFGLSCRRHGIILVLKLSGNILTLCQRDVLL